MKQANKGFTLVELIATIAILGVLSLIVVISVSSVSQKMRETHYEKQSNLIQLAGKDYFSDYRSLLPKKVTDPASEVSVKELVDRRYMDPPKDYKGVSCVNEESKVYVRKKSNGEYQYDVYWTCDNGTLGGDTYKDGEGPEKPTITLDSKKDYAIMIEEGKDKGSPVSGICNTYYTINNEEVTDKTGIRYTGKFYVTDQTGQIIIRSVSYDCAGNVSEKSEPVTFYAYDNQCDTTLSAQCDSSNPYDPSCIGTYDVNKKACLYQYHSNVVEEPICNKTGESKYSATECSRSKESYCKKGSKSGSQCLYYDYYSGASTVHGNSCCSCYRDAPGETPTYHTGSYGGQCKATNKINELPNGGCPEGTTRTDTLYLHYGVSGYVNSLKVACNSGDECSSPNTSWEVPAYAKCEGYLMANPHYTSFSYRCPSGYTTVDGTCVRTAEIGTTYICQSGDTRTGVTCAKQSPACKDGETYEKGKCYSLNQR